MDVAIWKFMQQWVRSPLGTLKC